MTTIPIYYDPAYPGIYVGSQVYPPGSLQAIINGQGLIEVWLGAQVTRVVGPVPYTQVVDKNGDVFASASLLVSSLTTAFTTQPPSGGASQLVDEYTATVNGAQTRTVATPLPSSAMLYINGLAQSATAFSVSGTTATYPATLNIQVGDLVTLVY